MRRSYLFVTWEGGGNVAPVLGLAKRLVGRGHDVRVLCEPCHESAVRTIGARPRSFSEHFTRTDRSEDILRDWEARTPIGGIKRSLEHVWLGPAEITAVACEEELRREPADAVVVDFMMPGAGMAAEALELPFAFLVHSINLLPAPGRPAPGMPLARGPLGRLRDRLLTTAVTRTFDAYLPNYNRSRKARGLPPLGSVFDQYSLADRVLVQTSAAFDFLGQPEAPNVRYVGPVLDEPEWLSERQWQNPWPANDSRPLVLVSLSSTFQNQGSRLAASTEALGGIDVRALVTVGPAMLDQQLDAHSNVEIVESAPHGLVFPHASVFVSHCGHGSVMRSLAASVPIVALPMGRDQDSIARRIVERGVGLCARPEAGSIRKCVAELLVDESYRARARELAGAIERDQGSDLGTQELEGLGLSVATERAAAVG